MIKKKNLKKQYRLSRSSRVILIIIILVVFCLLGWLLIWRTGWPDYIGALNKCGGHPPIVANAFISPTYKKPGDKSYKIPIKAGAIENVYYCNEQDAISAGYKHTIY